MRKTIETLLRIALFVCVFLVWMWVLRQPFSETVNLSIIIGAVILVFPIVWLSSLLLDRDPRPASAEWLTTLVHALVMILFGAAIIRAVTTYEDWRGWLIPIPAEVGLLLALITGLAAGLAVLNLALRGWGAPFGIALSRRLAIDWLYAWTRNPMVVASLAFLLAVGIWFRSTLFLVWAAFLVIPALLFFVKVFEERELEIRFGAGYRDYKARTPMLIPRRPAPQPRKPARSPSRSSARKRTGKQRAKK
jgi:protein-S-isoprenylcysteine O-methyltransferase Ste14